MNKVEITFNSILQEKLKGKSLSLLAKELDIPKSLIHDWVRSGRTPSLKNIAHIKAIADYFDMTLDELLIGQSESLISSISFKDENRKYKIDIKRIH